MTVKATYNGLTFEFPDGTPDEAIYSHIQNQAAQGNKDYRNQGDSPIVGEDPIPEQSWGLYNEGQGGSIWETAKARVGAQAQAMLTSAIENDPELSRYSVNKLKTNYDKWESESGKLGVVGNVAAGVTAAGVPIAAGVVNPALGMAAMGAQSTGDALLAQYEQGQDLDFGRAANAGMSAGAVDMALGGAGKFLAKPGAGLVNRAQNFAKEVLAEDVTSNVAAQVFENMASGRDWNQDTDVAALMGGAAGAGIRGSMSGLNKALNIPFNKSGERAVSDTVDLDNTPGPKPVDGFKGDYIENSNAIQGLRDNIMNMSDPNEITKGMNALNNQLEAGNHLDATVRVAKALQKDNAHIIDSIYDADIELPNGEIFNVGVDGLGLDKTKMKKTREDMVNSIQTPFIHSGIRATEKAVTGEAFNAKSQEDGRRILKNAKGFMDANRSDIKKQLEIAKQSDAPKETQALWNRAFNSYNELIESLTSMDKESGATNTMHTAKLLSRDFNDAMTRLGKTDMVRDMNGQTGNMNVLADFTGINVITQGMRKQNYQFNQGRPDPTTGVKKFAPLTALAASAPLAYLASPLVAAGAAGVASANEIRKMARRRKAGKSVEKAKSRLDDLIPEESMTSTLNNGGSPADVAAAAKADLETQGIHVPENEIQAEVTQAQKEATEAPVSPVQATPARSKPEAKTRPAPRPKAIEEPTVEPVVEAPAPKPEAKVAAAPKESRKAKRDKAKAERAEKRQAEQARIAAELQEKILSDRAGRRATKSPTQKVEEPVVEAPVKVEEPTPVVEAPKPKAKVAKTPKQKESIDTVVTEPEVKVEEPTVEATPKPEAKAAKTPKQKEVEQESAPEVETKSPLGKVKPNRRPIQKEEPVVEPTKVEEPTVEEKVEVAPTKPRVDAKTVAAPIQKKADESWPIGRRHKDPEGYQAHVQAVQDLKTFRKLIEGNEHYSKDEMAEFINDSGGIEKFLAAAKEAEDKPASYLNKRIRERKILAQQEAAKKVQEMKAIIEAQKAKEVSAKKEAEADKPKPASQKELDEQRRADDIKEFEGEMEARGIDEQDAVVVRESLKAGSSIKNARILAQRLHKERKQRMEQDIKDSNENIKEQNKILEAQGQRSQIDEYLRDIGGEDVPAVNEMISKVFKHAKGKVSDAKVKKLLDDIDSYFDSELKRYEALRRNVSDKDPRAPEYEAAGLINQNAQKALRANRAEVDAKYKDAQRNLSEEAVALQKAQSEYDRLFRDADTRDANLEIVSRQKEEMKEELRNAKVDDAAIDDHIKRTFYKRDATPLNPRELRKNMLDFFDAQAKSRETRIEKKKRGVDAAIKEADSNTLIEMSQNLVTDPDFVVADDLGSSENFVAMAKSLREAMEKKGLGKEATRLEAMNTAILDGLENKAKYPDNPELWVSADPFLTISRSFGNQTSHYQGNLGISIKLMVTGNKEGLKGFGTLKRSEMIAQQKKLDGEKQGALITDGVPDVVLKTK